MGDEIQRFDRPSDGFQLIGDGQCRAPTTLRRQRLRGQGPAQLGAHTGAGAVSNVQLDL